MKIYMSYVYDLPNMDDMWNLIAFAQGKVKRECLMQLTESPKPPKIIAKNLKRSLPSISRAIIQLSEKGLVECINPDRINNRFYKITNLGLEVVKELKVINKS